MPTIRRIARTGGRRARRRTAPRWSSSATSILDVVLAPVRPLERGTDVPGRVAIRQGGSAANTARWLGRLGVRTHARSASVGRDAVGRALVDAVRVGRGRDPGPCASAGAPHRAGSASSSRPAASARSWPTGAPPTRSRRSDLRAAWFDGVELLHLPAYSLLGEPLGPGRPRGGPAGPGRRRAGQPRPRLGRPAPGRRPGGRARARPGAWRPDLLFATAGELHGLLGAGGRTADRALALAPVVVVKRGRRPGVDACSRATGRARRSASTSRPGRSPRPTRRVPATRSTPGSSPSGWPPGRPAGRRSTALRRAAVAGNRIAGPTGRDAAPRARQLG